MKNSRDILEEQMQARMRVIPGFSQSDFARLIDMKPSRFSEILSGKHGLSQKWALRISDCLGFDEIEKEEFLLIVSSNHGRSKKERAFAAEKLNSLYARSKKTNIDKDMFSLISNFYHFAILEMLELENFPFDPDMYAKELGVNAKIIKDAVTRLERLNLIKYEGEKLVSAETTTFTEFENSSKAAKQFHRELLDKATTSLQVSPSKRFSESYVVGIDADRLDEFKKEFHENISQLIEKYGGQENRNTVFGLSAHFFPITQNKGGEQK